MNYLDEGALHLDGIIVTNKPYGATSHQVVQLVRRLFPGKKAGHSGTLDPIATGVLPVCLGRATRIAEYIIEHPKTYRAAVTLGKTTDTDDSEGAITGTCAVPDLDRNRVEEILSGFQGNIEQLPPMYSAVKYQGKPLYHWTRSGREVPRKSRRAEIYWIELLEFNPDSEPQLVFDVQCSKGTYIRTLAVDIGLAAGCGGHLQALTRLAVGPYGLDNASTPEMIEKLSREERFDELIKPMDSALTFMPALYLDHVKVEALKNGQVIKIEDAETGEHPQEGGSGEMVRIYDNEDGFKAIALMEKRKAGTRLKTVKYLAP